MYRVMLDPGHGGDDVGASNAHITEKQINLRVANSCRKFLERYPEIDVKMTRYQDTTVSLDSRCKISNMNQSNVFVSIHHNAGGGDGYEVYHFTNSAQGSNLANLIADEFDSIGQNKRYVGSGLYAGSQPGNYFVLANTDCPASLGEFGFIDAKDYLQFDEDHELIEIGRAYGRGILRYLGVEIKEESVIETVVPEVKECNCEHLEDRINRIESGIDLLYRMIKDRSKS